MGATVLWSVLRDPAVREVALFTHFPAVPAPDLRPIAAQGGVFCTTESVNDRTQWPFTPDVIASVYYRHLIRPEVIGAVDGRIFNLHPSLLPRHRGCSAVPWAIIEGDAVTGITYHYIEAGVDTGPVLLQDEIPITATTTQGDLYAACMTRGADRWPDAFRLVREGAPGTPQRGEACMHRRGVPYGGEIQDGWDAEAVDRFLRAMHYPPLPGATFRGRPVASVEEWRSIRRAIEPA